jgi:thiol-disulfide isomerase/thioredoxin
MLRLLIPSFLAFLANAPLGAQAKLEAGGRLPPIELQGLTQSPGGSFGDYLGRTVLLEFFAHWCGPCGQSVPHLNELQEKLGPRGFSVVAVTSEPAAKTEPWVKKFGVRYAYGYDPERRLQQLFQFTGIPFGALIDPSGKVVWTGHPMRLTEAEIEKALVGALPRPVWNWPEAARPLARSLAVGEYAAALALARTLPAEGEIDFLALVQGRLQPELARFEQLVAENDPVGVMDLGERLEKGLAGAPEGAAVVERLRALRADPEVMKLVTGTRRMVELEGRAQRLRDTTEAEALRVDVAAFVTAQAGGKLERRAKSLLDALDKALERARKNR